MDKVPKYVPPERKSAATIYGPWDDPSEPETSLIERCRRYWATPITELPNGILAMFLRQKIAVPFAAAEARKRLASGFEDGTELYDEELETALRSAQGSDDA